MTAKTDAAGIVLGIGTLAKDAGVMTKRPSAATLRAYRRMASTIPSLFPFGVQSAVLGRRHEAQIFRAIVARILVEVMDVLVAAKRAAKHAFHYNAVFVTATAWRVHSDVFVAHR